MDADPSVAEASTRVLQASQAGRCIREGKDAAQLKARYAAICDILIEGLVDPQEFPDFVCCWTAHDEEIMDVLTLTLAEHRALYKDHLFIHDC